MALAGLVPHDQIAARRRGDNRVLALSNRGVTPQRDATPTFMPRLSPDRRSSVVFHAMVTDAELSRR